MKYGVKNSAAESDTLDVYIYSDIVDDVTAAIYSSANIELMSAGKFQKMLDQKKDAKQINLYINSCGGDVMDGVAIYSQIRRHNAHVTAYIDGWACSIASVIPMAADKIIMSEASMMMIHHPWSACAGNADEFRRVADALDSILEGSIIPAYKSKCGDKISDSKLREYLKNEKMLTAKECLQYGFCDEITERESAEDEAKKAIADAQNQAKISYMNRLKEMYASLKMPSVLSAAETAENAADKQQEYKYLDAEKTKVIKAEDAEKNPVNAEKNDANAAEKQQGDVTDITDGNIGENESEPEKEDKTPEPAEDTKARINEYFMNLLKGEM